MRDRRARQSWRPGRRAPRLSRPPPAAGRWAQGSARRLLPRPARELPTARRRLLRAPPPAAWFLLFQAPQPARWLLHRRERGCAERVVGTTDVAAGSVASTLAGATVVSGGRAAGAAVESLASTPIGAAATDGAAAGAVASSAAGAACSAAAAARAAAARAAREPSNRRGRADGCIVLGEGGRAYRAERDKPGRQRRGYRGPHRRPGGR